MHTRQIVVTGVVTVSALTAAVVILFGAAAGGPGAHQARALPARKAELSAAASVPTPSTTISTEPDGCINGLTAAAQSTCQAFAAQQSQQNATMYPASGAVISVRQAIADATEPSEAGATFDAVEMTYTKAATYMETGNPNLSPTMPVYIVTAHLASPQSNSLAINASDESSYTAVSVLLNAITGQAVDSCSGCDIVQANDTVVSALG